MEDRLGNAHPANGGNAGQVTAVAVAATVSWKA